jgi:hypothetical protein
MKRRSIIVLVLGLTALIGLVPRDCRAAGSLLEILFYSGKNPKPFYKTDGNETSITVDVHTLNEKLKEAGFAYSFTTLGAKSNFPGQNIGGLISVSGTFTLAAGQPAPAMPLEIVAQESGFTLPAARSQSELACTATATYTGAAKFAPGKNPAPTTIDYGLFLGSSKADQIETTKPVNLNANGTSKDGHADASSKLFGSYLTPYKLENIVQVQLKQSDQNTTASDSFTGATLITTTNPEPASMVMMVAGMSAVVVSLLCRRAGARRCSRPV